MVGPDPSILRFTAATRYLFLVHTILRSNYSYAPSRQCSMFTFQLYGKGGGGVMVEFLVRDGLGHLGSYWEVIPRSSRLSHSLKRGSWILEVETTLVWGNVVNIGGNLTNLNISHAPTFPTPYQRVLHDSP